MQAEEVITDGQQESPNGHQEATAEIEVAKIYYYYSLKIYSKVKHPAYLLYI